MNKDNILRSSEFYMAEGDVLHLLFIDESGSEVTVEVGIPDAEGEPPPAPVAKEATLVGSSSFVANWYFSPRAEEYYIDVALDENFENILPSCDNLPVGNVDEYKIEGLSSGTTYYYRVRAYNKSLYSDSSNVIVVNTPYVVVYDYDGNEYSTIQIGGQLWMVENLRTTHYNDGSPIINMIYDTWQNQANSWTNGYGGYSFDTFATSGSNITSGIKAPGGYGYAKINETISLQEGDYLYYNIGVTINSGSGLNVVLFKNGVAVGWNGLNNGTNKGGFIIVSAGDYSLGICTLTTVGIDFSAIFLMADNYHRGWDAADYGCYCWYDNNDSYKVPYGALYNWYAVVDARGLVPEGWRVPTTTDFETLHNYLATNAGGKLKEIGTTHWDSPNTEATNESGFSAVGNGWRSNDGSFANLKTYGTFWSQSAYSSYQGYYALLYALSGNFNYNTYASKYYGFAVRCVKDI